MRILITGAAGFLGRACVLYFKNGPSSIITTDKVPGCDFTGDLVDVDFVSSLPDVDVVINCAAVQYVTSNKPIFFRNDFFKKNNIDSIKNLIARYEYANVHFINIGTSMQYLQDGSERYTEKSKVYGQGIYSQSKVSAYQLLSASSLRSCTVVPSIIGGLGREGLFCGFVNSILKYRVAIVPGDGSNAISMVHVNDVVSLVDVVVKKRATGTYNAAASDSLSINQWVEVIGRTLKSPKVLTFHLPIFPIYLFSLISGFRLLAREQLLMLRMPHVIDIAASRALGWTPEYSSEKIISDIVSHITKKSYE